MVAQLTTPVITKNTACILVECKYGNDHWWRCKILDDPADTVFPLSPICDYADSISLEELKIWCDMQLLPVRYVVSYEKINAYYACANTKWGNTFNG